MWEHPHGRNEGDVDELLAMASDVKEPRAAPGAAPAPGMVWIPGGTFTMGSSFEHFPE